MSIKEIENRIIEEAQKEAAQIKASGEKELQALLKVYAAKKEELRQKNKEEREKRGEEIQRSHLVPARLKAKKELLEAKQKVLSQIYAEIQKEKRFTSAELNQLREATEVRAVALLFNNKNKYE
jgi:V/A-type H+-transporting ATPase subunit E